MKNSSQSGKEILNDKYKPLNQYTSTLKTKQQNKNIYTNYKTNQNDLTIRKYQSPTDIINTYEVKNEIIVKIKDLENRTLIGTIHPKKTFQEYANLNHSLLPNKLQQFNHKENKCYNNIERKQFLELASLSRQDALMTAIYFHKRTNSKIDQTEPQINNDRQDRPPPTQKNQIFPTQCNNLLSTTPHTINPIINNPDLDLMKRKILNQLFYETLKQSYLTFINNVTPEPYTTQLKLSNQQNTLDPFILKKIGPPNSKNSTLNLIKTFYSPPP